VPYDFRRPTKLTREHVRMLQMAYETFARRYTTLLTSSLRVASQITLIAIEQITYDEYISGLDNPTCMFMVELEPMPAKTIFEMSPSMPLVWVDHMLGGPGGKQPERPLTDIETPLVHGVLERILDELRFSFESIVDLTPRIVGLEYNPQFAQAASASDAVIIVSFEMRVGAEECIGTVCTPFAGLLPHLAIDSDSAGLSAAQRQARDAAQRSMTAGLGNTPSRSRCASTPCSCRPVTSSRCARATSCRWNTRSRTRWPSPRPGSRSRTPSPAVPGSAWPASSCRRPRRKHDDQRAKRAHQRRTRTPREARRSRRRRHLAERGAAVPVTHARVLAAAEAAVGLLPAATPLVVGAPTDQPVTLTGQAVSARFTGTAQGEIVVVVGRTSSRRWPARRSARSTSVRRCARRWRRPRRRSGPSSSTRASR
jgi:flagellar motor switch protein FliM